MREQSNNTRQQNNISLFTKFCLPGGKENNVLSLEQIKCDNNPLDYWWGTSMVFMVFCRQDFIQLSAEVCFHRW
jgi:hypothetical protein